MRHLGGHRRILNELNELVLEDDGARRRRDIPADFEGPYYVFVITDPDDVAEAVSAMRLGATKVIEIPPSYAALRDEVTRATQ